MTKFAAFGDPARFEIAVRWIEDREPRGRRPLHGGWSSGELRLTVCGHVLTEHRHHDRELSGARWYLMPVFEWLSRNWAALLHEEHFAWRENGATPAATAVFLALGRFIGGSGDESDDVYSRVQAWWSRHALRAADPSALFPDVVFRRLVDDIEISWTARQPAHAPAGFRYTLNPGAATLAVEDVARPLWAALKWASEPGIPLDPPDRRSVDDLRDQLGSLENLTAAALEGTYLTTLLLERIESSRHRTAMEDGSAMLADVPAIERLDDAVLMFGGGDPDLKAADVTAMMTFLAAHAGGEEREQLAALVDTSVGAPIAAPFEEGYQLAESLLDRLGLPTGDSFIDIDAVVSDLGIEVVERALLTQTIRGVALAGLGYAPAVLVNTSSHYNSSSQGRRFTLAHEFFHVLYDRTRAQRVTHTSGPWAAPGIEKRANAFAAMLLMPQILVRRYTPKDPSAEAVTAAAQAMRVSVSALVEHLYNIAIVDEFARDRLRMETSRP